MDAKLQRRLSLLGALLLAGSAAGFVMFGSIGENLVYFWDAKQLVEAGDEALGATVRLGGLVQAGSVQWSAEAQDLSFAVTEASGAYVVKAHAKGAPPQMFREGIGVVVEGKMQPSGVFECDRVMVKHSNEYRAPQEGVATDELYKTLEEEF